MIGEKITLIDNYFDLSGQLINHLQKESLLDGHKVVIGICGESGSGKSVTARCLQIELQKINVQSFILHQDNYYKLPPSENHNRRKLDLNWVGQNEVQMDLMQEHISRFKTGSDQIEVPVVNYATSSFSNSIVDLNAVPVLLVEGVYSFALSSLDFKVFLERTYQETAKNRKMRNREKYDPFVEAVLKVEHEIVSRYRELTDVVITKDYSLKQFIQ